MLIIYTLHILHIILKLKFFNFLMYENNFVIENHFPKLHLKNNIMLPIGQYIGTNPY